MLLALAGTAGAAQSSPATTELWGPSFGVPDPSEVVASAGGGETAVAWHVSEDEGFASTVHLSRHGQTDGWGATEAVSYGDEAAQNDKEGLAVDAHGNALLAWEGENKVGSDLYIDEVPNGQPAKPAVDFWHDAGTINGINTVTVSFDGAGDASIMWEAGSGLYLARRLAGGSFGSPVKITDSGETENLEWPSFASGANGDAALITSWGHGGMAAALIPHGSGPGGVQILQSERSALGTGRIAMAPNGETTAAWETEEYHEAGEHSWDGWLKVATRAPGANKFSTPTRIDPITNIEGLAIAVSPAGEVTLLYNEVGKLVAVSRAPDGEWRPPERVGSIPATADPAAAYDSSGNLYVAWHCYEYSSGEELATGIRSGYYAATRNAGGSFDGQAHGISRPIPGVATAPAIAAEDGGAFAAWSLYEEGRVEASDRFYAPWREPAAPLSSAPSGPGDETWKSPPSAPVRPVAPAAPVAKPARPAALARDLDAILNEISTRLRGPKRTALSIRSPGAGLLTIKASPSSHSRVGSARTNALVVGRWVLRHPGAATIRVAPGRRVSRFLARSDGLLLTATFRQKDGRSTTARLRWAR